MLPSTNRSQVDSSPEVRASVDGIVAELLLDTKYLVELGQTLRSGGRTRLDLSSAQTNNDIGDGHIFGLTRAVRDHDTPTSTKGVLGSLDGLGDGTDLIDLEKKGVARLEFNSLLDELRVGDGQIITIVQLDEDIMLDTNILTQQSGSRKS